MAQFTGSLVVKGNVEADSLTGSLQGTATTASYVAAGNIDGDVPNATNVYIANYPSYNGNQRVAFVGGVNQYHNVRADTEFNFNPGANLFSVPNATFSGTVKANLISQSAQVTIGDTTGNLDGSRVVGNIQASSVDFANVLNRPSLFSSSLQSVRQNTVSSSTQIEALGFVTSSLNVFTSSTQIIQNLPANTVSSSTQIINLIENTYGGNVISSSVQIDFTEITNTENIISSSTQINFNDISNTENIISSSTQINFNDISNTENIISSSTQINFNDISNTENIISSSTQVTFNDLSSIPENLVSASSDGNTHINAMQGYQQEGSIRFGRFDGIGRFHEIKGYNTSGGSANWMSLNVHNGTLDSTTEVMRLRGDGTIKAPLISQSAQVDLASATGTAANATAAVTATTASYVSGSNVDGEVYEAERARRIEVGSYGSYSNLTDIPFITGDYGSSIKRISADGALQWHAGTNHLTVHGVDATTLTGSLDYSYLKNVPGGILSSSAGLVPDGTVSSSAQIQANLPAGLFSSSNQVNADSIQNFDTNVESALNNNSVNFGTGTVTADVLTTQRINSETDSAENITFENQRIKFRVGEGYQTGQEVFTIERDTDGAYDVTVFKGYSSSANFQVKGKTVDQLLMVKSTFDRVSIGGDTYDELFCVNGHQFIRNGILRMYQDGGGSQQHNLIIGNSAAYNIHNGDNYTSTFHSNTIIGDQALYRADNTSNNNVVLGDWIAYEYSDMGQYNHNVLIGNQVSRYGTDVEYSVGIGYSALSQGGNYSVGVGYGALAGQRAGSYNVGIGALTGFFASSSAADFNVHIGYKAGPNNAASDDIKTADAQLYIGYDAGEDALIRGDMRRRNLRIDVADDYQYGNRNGNPGFYVTGSSFFTGSVDIHEGELNIHNGLVVTGSISGIDFTDLDNIPSDIISSSGQLDVRSFGGDGSITGSLKVTSFVTASEFKGNATTATRIDGFTNMNDVAGNYPLLITAHSESGMQSYGEIGYTGKTTQGGGLYFNPDRSGNNTDCQLTIGNSGNTGILDVDRIDVGVDIIVNDGTISMTGIQNGGDIRFYNLDGFAGDPASSSVGSLWRSGANLYYRSTGGEKAKVVTDTDEVLKIAQSDPLPTGGVGQMAVSASNLYFHNGTSWSQIN